jgi:hypothetical protein
MSSDIDDDFVAARPANRPRQVDILLLLSDYILLLDTYIDFDVFKYSYFLLLLGRGLCFFVTE